MSSPFDDNLSEDWQGAEALARDGFELAERGLRGGDAGLLERAARALRSALHQHPENAAWHLTLARVLEGLGEVDLALVSYETARRFSGGLGEAGADSEATRRHGRVLLTAGRAAEALRLANALLHPRPEYEPAYCLKIRALTQLHRHGQAEETFYLARQYTDRCAWCEVAMARSLVARRKIGQAGLILRPWLAEAEVEGGAGCPRRLLGEVMLLGARVSRGEGRLGEARARVKAGLAAAGGQGARAAGVLGELWLEAALLGGGNAEVESAFGRAIELGGSAVGGGLTARVRVAYGTWLWRQRATDRAKEQARLAREASQTGAQGREPGAHLLLARLGLTAGPSRRFRRAREHLRREVRVAMKQPSDEIDPGYLLELSEVLTEVGRPRWAVRVLQRLVEVMPESAKAWQNLGAAHFVVGQPDEGMHACLVALDLAPEQASVLYNVALAKLNAGELSDALTYARRGVAAAPGDAAARGLLARVWLARGVAMLWRFLPPAR